MPAALSGFAARLREAINRSEEGAIDFPAFASELFGLQFRLNPVYRRICEATGVEPQSLTNWRDIPCLPTASFKDFEVTSLPPGQRTCVFHSSGTTGQRPSRHFHGEESLATYQASLWPWFAKHVIPEFKAQSAEFRLALLSPPPEHAPHSSLVHMFETVRRRCDVPTSAYLGVAGKDGEWSLDFDKATSLLRESAASDRALVLLGTAFSFVQLLEFLERRHWRFALPAGSRVMETGGYKGRSRALPKAELHALIADRLGIQPSHIICEYGMSELSSQAYDSAAGVCERVPHELPRLFDFPPWARVQIVSPETGREVVNGETGLIRVFDLANVWSVMAVQTEDLGLRRDAGFELLGRTPRAEPRGCSLLQA